MKTIIFDSNTDFYGRVIHDYQKTEFIWYVCSMNGTFGSGIADSWEEAMEAVEFVAENNGGKVV